MALHCQMRPDGEYLVYTGLVAEDTLRSGWDAERFSVPLENVGQAPAVHKPTPKPLICNGIVVGLCMAPSDFLDRVTGDKAT